MALRTDRRLRQAPVICSTGLQGAAEQQAGGEHRAGGHRALDHQIGAEPQDHRLHRQAQEADDALHVGRTVARHDLTLQCAVAVAGPSAAAGHPSCPWRGSLRRCAGSSR